MEIKILDTTDSTNEEIKLLAKQGAPEFTAVAARQQTAGRGRFGRSFFSPKDAGLYLSILLRPDLGDGFKAGDITCIAAVAVTEAIKNITGIDTGIKWVNDIYRDGKKICGILAEAGSTNSAGIPDFVVLGIGVNLFLPEGGYPDDIKDRAGSLIDSENADEELKTALAYEVVKEFRKMYESCDRSFVGKYRERCISTGVFVDVISGEISERAEALLIDDECRLVVRYEDGRCEALSGGEISIRKA